MRPRFIAVVFAVAAVAAAFAARTHDTRAAATAVDGLDAVAQLAGSQLAVVVVTVHNGSHATITSTTVGSTVHAVATVAGAFGTPTGVVTGAMYANGTCSGTPIDTAGSTALVGGSVDVTALADSATSSGKLSFSLHYLGDATYAARFSACTAIDVAKATPSVGLKVHSSAHAVVSSVDFGDQVHAEVTVLSRVGSPTGSVTVSWWTNGTCSGAKEGAPGVYPLVGGEADTTFFKAFDAPGSYSFRAQYGGDAGFKATASACVAYAVKKVPTQFATALHDSHHLSPEVVTVGAQVHPYASLGGFPGQAAPSGLVTVLLFTDGACADADGGVGVAAEPTMELHALAAAPSQPGWRSWKLKYSGDALYAAKTGPCLSMAWKGVAATTLAIHDPQHAPVGSVTVGAEVHFRVVVSGDFGTPTGGAGVRQWDNATCSGPSLKIATTPLDGGIGHDPNHEFVWDAPGTYSFMGDYGGSTSYLPKSSSCVALTITAVNGPTPKPTAKPTATPAATPAATAAPGASGDPSASGDPGASVAPGTSAAPAETGAAVPGATSGNGAGASSGPAASAAPTQPPPTTPAVATAGDSGIVVLLLLVIVLLLLAIAFMVWRSRQAAAGAAR